MRHIVSPFILFASLALLVGGCTPDEDDDDDIDPTKE